MGNRFIRISTAATVVGIGAIAAVISYRHAYGVAVAHGESTGTGRLVPLTVDGLVFVASMVLLDAARRRAPAPPLARLALALGIGATIAVNVLHGIAHGLIGAIISAWPAVCLVVVVELLMGLIRAARQGVRPAQTLADEERVSAAVDTPVATPVISGDGSGECSVDTPGEGAHGLRTPALPWWPLPAIGAAGQDHVEDVPHMVDESTGRDRGDGDGSRRREAVDDEADDLLRDAAKKVPDPELAPVVATARDRFAEVLAAGGLPSVRRIRKELRVGHPRAVAVREALQSEVAENVPAMV